jgi:hypothetical protein
MKYKKVTNENRLFGETRDFHQVDRILLKGDPRAVMSTLLGWASIELAPVQLSLRELMPGPLLCGLA